MKLLSTEIDDATMQLTYTDGSPANESKELIVLRLPLQGELTRSVMWHQFQLLRKAQDALEQEARILRDQLEK